MLLAVLVCDRAVPPRALAAAADDLGIGCLRKKLRHCSPFNTGRVTFFSTSKLEIE